MISRSISAKLNKESWDVLGQFDRDWRKRNNLKETQTELGHVQLKKAEDLEGSWVLLDRDNLIA